MSEVINLFVSEEAARESVKNDGFEKGVVLAIKDTGEIAIDLIGAPNNMELLWLAKRLENLAFYENNDE